MGFGNLNFGWKAIDQMKSSCNCIRLTSCENTCNEEEGLRSFKNMFIFPFNYPILLWCLGIWSIMDNVVELKVMIYIFSTIVRMKNSNMSRKSKFES
jgi:hypothetical protein